MALTISLLGPPSVERDGTRAPAPRGAKAWAVLALLVLTGAPQSRERLATLLFGEADDPLSALRWNLAQLRRLLGPDATLGGDPVELVLPPDALVDVRSLVGGTWVEALRLPGLGLELLEGINPVADAAFDAWLLAERRRTAGLAAGVLREAAVSRLAAGDTSAAIDLATRHVALDEFDEEAHALLVRAYAASGDMAGARSHLQAALRHFRDELGVEPSATLLRAADPLTGTTSARAARGTRATAESLIAAGEAAIAAGAIDAGFDTLRRAVADAEDTGDRGLTARALVALGEAYIHGGRGRDGEGSTTLHAALTLGEELGDAGVVSEASRELGYVEFLRGRYDRADAWLERATDRAPDAGLEAAALSVRGAVATDLGRTGDAIGMLARSAEIAEGVEKPRLRAWASAFLGRAHLLRGELPESRAALDLAVETIRSAGWMTFLPFAQAFQGDLALAEGRVSDASDAFDAAFALGCQIGDPCWEGLGARGIGLVRAVSGDLDDAVAWLDDARTRCVRIPDAYLWIQGYCLDALVGLAVEHRLDGAERWLADLEALSARTGMHELLVRALLHRDALGDRSGAHSAAVVGERIDNPILRARLSSAGPVAV